MAGMVKKWISIVLFPLFLIVLIAGSLPLLVEEFVLPPVLDRVGLSDYKISLSRLGFNGCSIHVGGQPHFSSPVVSGALRIDWTPSGLLQGRIDKVSSNGLHLDLTDLPSRKYAESAGAEHINARAKGYSLPVVIDRFLVNNGSLLITLQNRDVYLPFTLDGQRIIENGLADTDGTVSFTLKLEVADQSIDAAVQLYPDRNELSVKLDAQLDLSALTKNGVFQSSNDLQVEGDVQFTLSAAILTKPFDLVSASGVLESDDLKAFGRSLSVEARDNKPVNVTLSGSGSQLQVKGEGLYLGSPVQTTLGFDTIIVSSRKDLHWEGVLVLEPEAGPAFNGSIELKDTSPVRISHAGEKNNEKISMHLKTEKIGPSAVVFLRKDVAASIEGLYLDAHLLYRTQVGGSTFVVETGLSGQGFEVSLPEAVVKVPEFSVQAEGNLLPDTGEKTVSTRFNLENASLNLEKSSVQVRGIDLDVPVTWPYVSRGDKGVLRGDVFLLNGKDLGKFTAEIVQDKKRLGFDGAFHTPLIPEKKIEMSGFFQLPKEKNTFARFAFALQNGHIDSDNFVSVFPALQGVKGSGDINLKGDIAVTPCGLSGQADLVFANGILDVDESETKIENIGFNLHFPSLPSLQTNPMQQFSIGTIRKKKLEVSDVKARFEIESPNSLFVEKIAGRWSGGRVFTSSFRLQKNQEELDVALFCDRLELSSILSQFSLAEAGGEGRLSGRVPLMYTRGRFYVDDGFLFSTPGEKGYLKIKQSEYLETTVPSDVPQFSPLHFAGAALADFEYNWAKLQIKSEEENLLLKLQVDGKPKEKLPFRFDTKNNVFVRLDDESSGGIDQSIKLDVNFNVPVNEMFQYKDRLMPLFRQFN